MFLTATILGPEEKILRQHSFASPLKAQLLWISFCPIFEYRHGELGEPDS